MLRSSILACLLIAGPVFGQQGPSFDCVKAESATETLVCEDAGLARLDRLIADRYAAALDAVRILGAGARQAESRLRATQRGWIKGRDDCWKADDPRHCVEWSYSRREGELVARWMLQDPIAVAYWACGDSPANEVVTHFFDTTVPSIRFERGDRIDTGSLTPTASGSRYEGSFGRSIWIRGDRAIYREPDPDGSTFDCLLARRG